MGTYSKQDPMIPEANAGASVSHFAWFYPGNYFQTSKPSSNALQGAQVNAERGLPIPPIRSVAPTKEPINDVNQGIRTTKGGKQKQVKKSANLMASKPLKPKQPKKKASSKKEKAPNMPEAKREKRNINIDIDSINFDLSGIPSPICSCTGMARVCYKWGAGGWQSSCCTINISEYPLPMSSTRPGARMAGRKMSNGAYAKLLLRLTAEGYDLSHPVDLKNHWARHGTNKFVIIK